MTKLQKNATRIDKILKYLYWINLAAFVILFLLMAFLWRIYAFAPEISQVSTVALDFGGIEFMIDPSYSHHPHAFTNHLSAMTIIMIPYCIIWCMFIRCGRRILAPMMEGQPFHSQMSAQLKRLGWLNIALGVLNNAGSVFFYGNLIPGYDLDALFLGSPIVSYEIHTQFDIEFLLWSAIMFLLPYVCKHGWERQQLSDETL